MVTVTVLSQAMFHEAKNVKKEKCWVFTEGT